MALIRQARRGDVAQVAAIWNRVIRETVITFNPQEKSEAEVARTVRDRAREGHPFLVALAGAEVLGFATYAQFRAGAGYARTMEHSIQLVPAAQGQGLGRRLMAALEAHAAVRGMHAMVGAVTADSAASIAFHAALGYAVVGRMPEVGWKFGRYHDLVLMQKVLASVMGDSGQTG